MGVGPVSLPTAIAAGFRSVQALPMRLRGVVIGALNLFSVVPGHMEAEDVEAAQAMADVATIAVLQHRAALEAQILNEQLNYALNSRIVIEQAKGMVAERTEPGYGTSLRYFAQSLTKPQPAIGRLARDITSAKCGCGGARSASAPEKVT